MPERIEQLKNWLSSELDFSEYTLEPASSDASFRRYFRVVHSGESLVVMDAPPAQEDTRPFVQVSGMFAGLGLNVPQVIDEDPEQGFLLLSDLGSRPYLDALNDETVERLYGDALGALATIQACTPGDAPLPAYDRTLLLNEMELCREWLIGKHLGLTLTEQQSSMLDAAFDLLADSALQQPQVCVHRDYHSRNLMLTESNNPGILDIHDAVNGPLTNDLETQLPD